MQFMTPLQSLFVHPIPSVFYFFVAQNYFRLRPHGQFQFNSLSNCLRAMCTLDLIFQIDSLFELMAGASEAKDAYLNRESYRLDGRIIIITGSSAGCGKETARDLALRGATIIMANRDLEKTNRVIATLREQEGADNLPEERFVVKKLDLCDLENVKQFAEEVKKEYPVIDILINNAGKMGGPRQVTKDGFESQFQTNHLSHFLLTYLLIDNLLKSPNKPRVINLSSMAHDSGKASFIDDLQCEKSYPSQGFGAYCNTKLMNILFTKSLAEKYSGKITAYAVHPGFVKSELARSSKFAQCFYCCAGFMAKTERQGALTTIYCAVSHKAGDETGLYYADSKAKQPSKNARNMELAENLWKASCDLLKIKWEV